MKITLLNTNPHITVEVTEGDIYSLKFDHILLEDGKYLFNGEVFSPLGSSTEILPFAVMNWCTSLKLVSRAEYRVPDVSVLHSFVKPFEQVAESFANFNGKITMTMKPLSEEDANAFKELFEYNQEDIVNEETYHSSNKAKHLFKLAEELHDTYQKAWLEAKGVGRVYHWENASEAKKHAWVELARKYSQPTSDLQQQLDDALKSERELRKELYEVKKLVSTTAIDKAKAWDEIVNHVKSIKGTDIINLKGMSLLESIKNHITTFSDEREKLAQEVNRLNNKLNDIYHAIVK